MGHSFSFCKTCETPLDCDFCDRLDTLTERKNGHWVDVKGSQPNPGWKVRCSLCGFPQDYKHTRKLPISLEFQLQRIWM